MVSLLNITSSLCDSPTTPSPNPPFLWKILATPLRYIEVRYIEVWLYLSRLEKESGLNGIRTSAIPVQCSFHWAINPGTTAMIFQVFNLSLTFKNFYIYHFHKKGTWLTQPVNEQKKCCRDFDHYTQSYCGFIRDHRSIFGTITGASNAKAL